MILITLPSPDEKYGDTGCQDDKTKYSHYHRHKVKVGILGRGRLLKIFQINNVSENISLKFKTKFQNYFIENLSFLRFAPVSFFIINMKIN